MSLPRSTKDRDSEASSNNTQHPHPIENALKSAKTTRLAPLDASINSFDKKIQSTTTAMRKSIIHESKNNSAKSHKARMSVDEEDDGRADDVNSEEEAIWRGKFEPLLATLSSSFSGESFRIKSPYIY